MGRFFSGRTCILFLLSGFALWSPALSAQDEVIHAAGLIELNREIAQFWLQDGRPALEAQLRRSSKILNGLIYQQGGTFVRVDKVHDPQTILHMPPALTRLDAGGLELKLPVTLAWVLRFSFDVTASQQIGPITLSKSFRLDVNVPDLRVTLAADLDSSDPEAPRLAKLHPPKIDFTVLVTTDQWYLTIAALLFTPKINEAVDTMIADAIDKLRPTLDAIAGQPRLFGAGAPALTDSGAAVDFEGSAEAVSKKIRDWHLPFGSIATAEFGAPYGGTWSSLLDPGFQPGMPQYWSGFGDSAIWTGHYLAAEALRYKVTGRREALQQVRTTLHSFRALVNMRGTPGLLNRALQPRQWFPNVVPTADIYFGTWQGMQYILYDDISRDQYLGALLGVSAAHDYVDDPEVRTLSRQTLEEMLDYLLSTGWRVRKRNGEICVLWHLHCAQQLAWLNAGLSAAPLKYALPYAQHAGLSDLAWLTPWLESFDPIHSYFKFNLDHGAFYTWLRLEPFPMFWERGWKAFRVLRRSIGHHQNAWFNLCEMGVMPARRAALSGETREELRQWLRRKRRESNLDLRGNFPTVVYNPPLPLGFLAFAGVTPFQPPVTISSVPVPVDLRPSADFLWQNPPYYLTEAGDPRMEHAGIDYLLPYWMSRFHGVLP